MRRLTKSLLALLLTGSLGTLAQAQNFWIGNAAGTSTAWSVTTNWSAGHTPSGGENVSFDGTQTLNQTTKVPTSMAVSINCDLHDLAFQNGFNPTNTTLIGSSSATAKVITIEDGAFFVVNAFSGMVTFQPFNGGAGALSLALNGTVTLGVATGGTLNLLTTLANGTNPGIVNLGTGTGTVILGNANTYTGGTLLQSGGTTQATHDGAFGTGNLTLMGGPITLTLSGGATNDYIANGATFSIATGDTINLNFTGTDLVSALVINGVPQAAGVYNSGNVTEFLGTGSITVIPEPATWALLSFSGLLVIGARRARSRRSACG